MGAWDIAPHDLVRDYAWRRVVRCTIWPFQGREMCSSLH